MPQLNPDPWLLYLTATWLMLIILAPRKISGHININEPTPKNTQTINPTWTWPWQ